MTNPQMREGITWHRDRNVIGATAIVIVGITLYWWMFFDIGLQTGRHQERVRSESAHYARDGAFSMERKCAAQVGEKLRQCARQVVSEERESQRQESDLAAQWSVADWARWATILAGAQFIATVVGLILVKGTLDATWKAVEETDRATGAMLTANEVTERIGKAQVRAYTSAVAKSFTIDDDGWCDLTFEVTNSGQSPARDVHVQVSAFYITAAGSEQSMGSTIRGLGDVAAGEKRPVVFELDAETGGHPAFDRNKQGGGSFDVRVSTEYATVFDDLSGAEHFLFEAFVLDDRRDLRLRARPKRRIMRVGGRARRRKAPS